MINTLREIPKGSRLKFAFWTVVLVTAVNVAIWLEEKGEAK